MRALALTFLAAIGLLLVACEKPDASDTTSPSVRSMLGTTTGNVAYSPPEAPPAPVDPPSGWALDIDVALLSELENGTPSLRFSLQVVTQPGPAMEIWLAGDDGTVARWSGGSARKYDGVVCFQLTTVEGGEALQLEPNKTYTATIAFREPEGKVIAARRLKVSGRAPDKKGEPPQPGAIVFSEALSCPRGG